MMHMMYMWLEMYISDEHERALKAKAKELGVSEAELVRRMLDGLLLDGEGKSISAGQHFSFCQVGAVGVE